MAKTEDKIERHNLENNFSEAYPDELIRGVFSANDVSDEGPEASLYKNFEESEKRTDDFKELSINWYDDERALEQIFNQKRENGEYTYKFGAAVVSRLKVKEITRSPRVCGKFKYERRKVEGNDYHGNLLLEKNTPRKTRDLIASTLALYSRIEQRKS